MDKRRKMLFVGGLIFIAAIITGVYWYGCKLIIVVMLFLWANNIERSVKNK